MQSGQTNPKLYWLSPTSFFYDHLKYRTKNACHLRNLRKQNRSFGPCSHKRATRQYYPTFGQGLQTRWPSLTPIPAR